MAQETFGVMSFPGINQIINGSYSLIHGISPGVAQLTIAPQENFIGASGDLIIVYADVRIVLPDSKLDKHSFQRTQGGLTWRLDILDRRWKWRFPTISGMYNLRDDGNKLIKDTEKTPQQLAKILLEEMGEKGFEVDKLPNQTRPLVEWDFTNAANALATLCDSLGCRVVLHIDNTVIIEKLGKGAKLPISNVSISDNTGSIDPPEKPGKLKAVGGLTRHQVDFNMFPVGLDVDGTIKPIEELSYAPGEKIAGGEVVKGWPGVDPEYPFDDDFEISLEAELAKTTVFRWYRIEINDHTLERFEENQQSGFSDLRLSQVFTGQLSGKFNAGPWKGELKTLDQILPLQNAQVDTRIENGVEVPKLPEIWGVWFGGELGSDGNITDDFLPYEKTKDDTPEAFYERPFELDTKKGLVKFTEPLYSYLINPNTQKQIAVSAKLAIRLAVTFKDEKTRAVQRFELERKIGPDDTKAQIIKRPEIVFQRRMQFSFMETLKQSNVILDNEEDVKKEANFYLDITEKTLNEVKQPQSIGYNGIVPIDVDGAIHQVTWSVGPSGAKTRASFNEEQEDEVRPYRLRREFERQPSELIAIKTRVERLRKEEAEF